MPEIDPGEQKYPDADSVRYDLDSDAAVSGDAVTISSANGGLVLTDGSNGFAGVLGTPTAAEGAELGAESGDVVLVQVQGIVRAKVSAAVGGSVSAGEQLVPGANGALVNVDDGGSPAQGGPGDLQAWSDEDAEGFALVRVP